MAVQRCFEEPAGTSFQPGWNDDDGDVDGDSDDGDDKYIMIQCLFVCL